MMIYHIADRPAWKAAESTGMYRHPTLSTEGFIHASTAAQLEETANRYYKENPEILVLVIDPAYVTATIKYEPSRGGELFPHLYGPLNLDAVQAVRMISRSADGLFKITPDHLR